MLGICRNLRLKKKWKKEESLFQQTQTAQDGSAGALQDHEFRLQLDSVTMEKHNGGGEEVDDLRFDAYHIETKG